MYAPTSAHSDNEVEEMYEDITKALHTTQKAHFNVVIGDFNAKVGVQPYRESIVGSYGFGSRNHRGQMLINFLEKEGLFVINSFFKKRPKWRWTWQSPDAVTRSEIDYIIADKRRIFRDVSVVTRFNTGSDHRLVRGTLNIHYKLERLRLIKSTLRPHLLQTAAGSETFQLKLENRFAVLETTSDVDIDHKLDQVVGILRDEGTKFYQTQNSSKKSKLSVESLRLIQRRRENPAGTSSDLNKKISKLVRRDLRSSNTRFIKEAIEQNRGSKFFVRRLGRSHLTKLTTFSGKIVTSKPDILAEVENFYGKLYASKASRPQPDLGDPRATLSRHLSENLPEVTQNEISIALGQLKNGKAPGEDGITTELLKAGGKLIIACLQRILIPSCFREKFQRHGTTVLSSCFSKRETKHY